MDNLHRYAIIMCGGSGTRLWPLSRVMRPKQFLAFGDEESLFQRTVNRLTKLVSHNHLYTVTHQNYKFEVLGQLTEKYPIAIQNILIEPFVKNTLPAIAWATYQIYQKDSEAIVGAFASDHSIDDEAAFIDAWLAAEQAAYEDYLVLLGIKPNIPESDYGYIKPTKPLELESNLPIYEVGAFVEKPVIEKAQELLIKGYLWNSGMFIFKAKTFMNLLKTYQFDIYDQITKISDSNLNEIYSNLPSISIDYGLVEKADKVAVVPVDMHWNDMGNWNSIYLKYQKDSKNNVLHGEVVSLNTTNSLLWTDNGLIATAGLNNIIVIQTSDATLICDKSQPQDIKLLVSAVKEKNPLLTEIHQTVYRPWGNYVVLEKSDQFKIKRIEVNPGAKLSLQLHKHRSEHWVIVSGIATIYNDGNTYLLKENESTYIPKTCPHRLSNETEKLLTIIEVQCGEYVDENDIVRFDDNYGRANYD